MGVDEGKNLASSAIVLYPVPKNLPNVKPFLTHAEVDWMLAHVLQFCHSPHFRNDLYIAGTSRTTLCIVSTWNSHAAILLSSCGLDGALLGVFCHCSPVISSQPNSFLFSPR
jgi:hypothetical protein